MFLVLLLFPLFLPDFVTPPFSESFVLFLSLLCFILLLIYERFPMSLSPIYISQFKSHVDKFQSHITQVKSHIQGGARKSLHFC